MYHNIIFSYKGNCTVLLKGRQIKGFLCTFMVMLWLVRCDTITSVTLTMFTYRQEKHITMINQINQ